MRGFRIYKCLSIKLHMLGYLPIIDTVLSRADAERELKIAEILQASDNEITWWLLTPTIKLVEIACLTFVRLESHLLQLRYINLG